MPFNALGEPNEISLPWIPAHCGYEGSEFGDQLAKRGSNNDRSSIYMRASYEELGKIGKNCEKLRKSDKK